MILNNNSLYVEIAEKGAEIRKVTLNGKDCMWSGNPDVWNGVAPVLFPICGGLKDDKFVFEGKEYNLEKHGFARKYIFTLEEKSNTKATFLLCENEETLRRYPWNFEFRVTYTLIGNSINITYDIKNKDEKTMYYSVGSHEAYACEEGIEDYDIIFEKEETLEAYQLDGTLLSQNKEIILKNSKVLPLYKKYFEIDALIFKGIKSRFVTLKNRKTEKAISVKFEGFDYLLLWHKYDSNYLCIEPWAGICSQVGDDYDITKKEGIIKLKPQEQNILNHTINF